MMPHKPVLDIMRRTMINLAFVQRHAGEAGPFEVTQLVNSFLGAMAHPWESLRTELNEWSIAMSVERGWPVVRKERPSDRDPKSLGDLIRLLRNGIAHGNIDYHPREDGHIGVLRIVNKNRQGRRTWGAILTPDDMQQFLDCFVALIEEIEAETRDKTGRVA